MNDLDAASCQFGQSDQFFLDVQFTGCRATAVRANGGPRLLDRGDVAARAHPCGFRLVLCGHHKHVHLPAFQCLQTCCRSSHGEAMATDVSSAACRRLPVTPVAPVRRNSPESPPPLRWSAHWRRRARHRSTWTPGASAEPPGLRLSFLEFQPESDAHSALVDITSSTNRTTSFANSWFRSGR